MVEPEYRNIIRSRSDRGVIGAAQPHPIKRIAPKIKKLKKGREVSFRVEGRTGLFWRFRGTFMARNMHGERPGVKIGSYASSVQRIQPTKSSQFSGSTRRNSAEEYVVWNALGARDFWPAFHLNSAARSAPF